MLGNVPQSNCFVNCCRQKPVVPRLLRPWQVDNVAVCMSEIFSQGHRAKRATFVFNFLWGKQVEVGNIGRLSVMLMLESIQHPNVNVRILASRSEHGSVGAKLHDYNGLWWLWRNKNLALYNSIQVAPTSLWQIFRIFHFYCIILQIKRRLNRHMMSRPPKSFW